VALAWEPPKDAGVYAIEVYPAATLKACGWPFQGYKGQGRKSKRRALVEQLGRMIGLPADRHAMERNDDALDAAICVLAAVDFLRGRACAPDRREIAEREGWIWVRAPE
jgi:hypothetical protein